MKKAIIGITILFIILILATGLFLFKYWSSDQVEPAEIGNEKTPCDDPAKDCLNDPEDLLKD